MKPLLPCLDCGALGPWRNLHGVRCRRCEGVNERARKGHYNQLRLFDPGGPCEECGGWDDLTFDHIVPISKGGETEQQNLRCLCRSCNSARRDRSVER